MAIKSQKITTKRKRVIKKKNATKKTSATKSPPKIVKQKSNLKKKFSMLSALFLIFFVVAVGAFWVVSNSNKKATTHNISKIVTTEL